MSEAESGNKRKRGDDYKDVLQEIEKLGEEVMNLEDKDLFKSLEIKKTPEGRRVISCLQALLSVTKKHLSNIKVLEPALKTLKDVCLFRDFEDELLEHGGIQLVLEAIEMHRDDDRILKNAWPLMESFLRVTRSYYQVNFDVPVNEIAISAVAELLAPKSDADRLKNPADDMDIRRADDSMTEYAIINVNSGDLKQKYAVESLRYLLEFLSTKEQKAVCQNLLYPKIPAIVQVAEYFQAHVAEPDNVRETLLVLTIMASHASLVQLEQMIDAGLMNIIAQALSNPFDDENQFFENMSHLLDKLTCNLEFGRKAIDAGMVEIITHASTRDDAEDAEFDNLLGHFKLIRRTLEILDFAKAHLLSQTLGLDFWVDFVKLVKRDDDEEHFELSVLYELLRAKPILVSDRSS